MFTQERYFFKDILLKKNKMRNILHSRFAWAFRFIPHCDKLLDVGGGRGDVTNEYLKKTKEVHLVEYDSKLISECKKRFPKVKAIKGVAEKIPYDDETFDVVTMTDTLEHVRDEKQSLNEVHRVLKKGGTLVISTPHKGPLDILDAFNLKYRLPKLYLFFKGEKGKKIMENDSWHRHYSLENYQQMFAGKFKIKQVHRGGFLLWYVLWIIHDALVVPIWGYDAPAWIIKPIDWLNTIDYDVNYGKWAAHIVLKAEKA
jgi:ubiquinone/menaquinone biosynthesis C-methylase UbiE